VSAALLLLITLIGMAPAVLGLDGPLALGLWAAVSAVALIVCAGTLRPTEARHFGTLVRPLAIVATIPAIFMIYQALPLPNVFRVNNTIWQSVAAALNRSLAGSISIDTGSTLLSLCRYLAWLAVGFLAGAITIDRQRAEWVLFAATFAATLIAALLIANDIAGFAWLDASHNEVARGAALDIGVLGSILSIACAVRAYERFETRRMGNGPSSQRLGSSLLVCLSAFTVCAVSVALAEGINTPIAAAAGLTTLLGVTLIRRIGLGRVGALIALAVVLVIAGEIAAARLGQGGPGPDFTLRFAAPSSPASAITERMLVDSSWTGTGAGTYHSLVPIYRGPTDTAGDLDPPSAAAEVAIELGRPLLWLELLFSCVVVVMLFRAALRRGRDSFYPAAGSAALVALLISAFGNDGLFESSVLIIAAVIIGLAVAQSRSRTAQ
jgi:hypothetical protein